MQNDNETRAEMFERLAAFHDRRAAHYDSIVGESGLAEYNRETARKYRRMAKES